MEKEKNDIIFDTKKETAEHASIKAPFKPFQTADQTCFKRVGSKVELQVKCRFYFSDRLCICIRACLCLCVSVCMFLDLYVDIHILVVGKALECMYGIFGYHRRLK